MTAREVLDGIRVRVKAYKDHGTPGLAAPQDRAHLMSAVDAVLALHKPFEWEFGFGPVTSCRLCADQGATEVAAEYPCQTVAAVENALKESQ